MPLKTMALHRKHMCQYFFEKMKLGRCVGAGSVLSEDERKISQGFVNIKNQTTEQLDELIKRQNKLLQNKSFLEKLPDKGKKIRAFKAQLEVELEKKKEECDAACKLLLNLSLKDKNAEEIEWNSEKLKTDHTQLDSDDDDDDDDRNDMEEGKELTVNPLQWIATHSGTAGGKIMKINSSEKQFQIKSLNILKKSLYIDKYCEKYEKSNEVSSKERFKPNRLQNNNKDVYVTSAENVKKRLGNKWEITEATPPAPVYKDVVMISLNESLKLQKEQAQKLKEIEQKQATEKLLQNISLKIGDKLPVYNVNEYRSNKNVCESSTDNDEISEFSDSEEEGKCFVECNDFES